MCGFNSKSDDIVQFCGLNGTARPGGFDMSVYDKSSSFPFHERTILILSMPYLAPYCTLLLLDLHLFYRPSTECFSLLRERSVLKASQGERVQKLHTFAQVEKLHNTHELEISD